VAGMLLVAFVVTEQRHRTPLVPFSIFRIEGLAAADATQVIAQAGFLSMFFFITLYMQNVLGFSPIAAGTAYLPVTVGVGIAAGISTALVARIGTRPIIVAGAVIGAGGVHWLSRIPVHGSYLTDLLPGLVVMALGLGAVMVGVQNAANAGVPADKAGLAAALITTSSTVGAALGLAILTAIATSRTNHLIAAHANNADALTSGAQRCGSPRPRAARPRRNGSRAGTSRSACGRAATAMSAARTMNTWPNSSAQRITAPLDVPSHAVTRPGRRSAPGRGRHGTTARSQPTGGSPPTSGRRYPRRSPSACDAVSGSSQPFSHSWPAKMRRRLDTA
jgi:hypothetical protein